jgi:hypothetical protein
MSSAGWPSASPLNIVSKAAQPLSAPGTDLEVITVDVRSPQ